MKKLRFVTALLCAAVICACVPLDGPIDEFFNYQTGTMQVLPVNLEAGRLETAEDGTICADPDVGAIVIPIANKEGYELLIDSPCVITSGGADIIDVSAVQDGDTVKVNVEGDPAYGDELTVHITAKNAAEGRIVYRGDVKIAYVNFDTTLASIKLNGNPVEGLNGEQGLLNNYSVFVPLSLNVAATARNSAALLDVSYTSESGEILSTASGTETATMNGLNPPFGASVIWIRVSAPHGVGEVREYRLAATQPGYISVSGTYTWEQQKIPGTIYHGLHVYEDSACTRPVRGASGGWTSDDYDTFEFNIPSNQAGYTIYIRSQIRHSSNGGNTIINRVVTGSQQADPVVMTGAYGGPYDPNTPKGPMAVALPASGEPVVKNIRDTGYLMVAWNNKDYGIEIWLPVYFDTDTDLKVIHHDGRISGNNGPNYGEGGRWRNPETEGWYGFNINAWGDDIRGFRLEKEGYRFMPATYYRY